MRHRIVPVTHYQQNCTLIWCEQTMKGAVVDPGGDPSRILAAAKEEGVTIEKILVTHAHADHAGSVAELAEALAVPVEGPHLGDRFWIDGMPQQRNMLGMPHARVFTPTRWLEDGDAVTVGNLSLKVVHCPGHTPGHVVFVNETARFALVGDVLFAGSIGRTDFPMGDHAALIGAITKKLLPMGDDITFVPGHGPNSTFGQERLTNPFLR